MRPDIPMYEELLCLPRLEITDADADWGYGMVNVHPEKMTSKKNLGTILQVWTGTMVVMIVTDSHDSSP